MLKRIKSEQVRLGMYVEAIEGAWTDHPFWRNSFLLKHGKDVERLKSSNVNAVVIDTGKGVDIAPTTDIAGASRPGANPELKRALKTIEHTKPMLKEMFGNARMGGVVSVTSATEAVEHIARSVKDSSSALIEITRLQRSDEDTFLHSIAVSALMIHLGRAIDLDEQAARDLGMSGLLHDIGKTKIPPAVLKKAGALTDEEKRLMRHHPVLGHALLERQGSMPDVVLDVCLHHHERMDGNGYPHGLKGDAICLPARIATICDVYDALTSERPYKKAWVPAAAAKFMVEQDGLFDKRLLMRFLYSLNI